MAVKTSGTAPKKAPAADISKMEAVRRAMAELGFDAGRAEIQTFVKERFGIEMSADVVSTYKADIARKAAKAQAVTKPVAMKSAAQKGPPAKKKVTRKAASKSQAQPAPTFGSNGKAAGIPLKDIQAVKVLVGTVGADTLKTLIDVLSK